MFLFYLIYIIISSSVYLFLIIYDIIHSKNVFLNKIDLLNNTIPHVTLGEAGGGRVILKPACPGTGIIAGGGIRAVLEMVGVKDVLSKSLGANNHLSMVRSTINALLQLRTKKQINALRATEGDVIA